MNPLLSQVIRAMGLVGALAETAGVREDALTLLLSVLATYGFSALYRIFFYNKPKLVQYYYFIAVGAFLYVFGYGMAIFHSIFAILAAYIITNFMAGTTESVIAAHVVFLGHLLVGYWFAESDQYDITWTTPFCIMTLRFIGLVMDVYDGVHYDTLKPDQKLTAIRDKPSLIEIAAFGWFFTGTLVGPQFTLSRFRYFVDGKALDENGQPRQSALMPSLGRFLAGCTYMVLTQWGAVWITQEWLNSDDFDSRSFFARWTWVTIWFRLTMYRYCGMWLISEGAAILNGISYNGKDEKGEDKWDGTRDLHIWLWESAHDYTSIVQSFNVGTNTFAKNHIFRRLRWLNSKPGAHLITLVYLAVWHGYHLGYFLLFFFEFGCVLAEQQLYGLIDRTPGWAEFLKIPAVRPFIWLFGKLLVNYSMGSGFLHMGLIKTKYWIRPAKSIYFIGFILYFLVWPITYQILLRVLPRKPKDKTSTTKTAIEKKEL